MIQEVTNVFTVSDNRISWDINKKEKHCQDFVKITIFSFKVGSLRRKLSSERYQSERFEPFKDFCINNV